MGSAAMVTAEGVPLTMPETHRLKCIGDVASNFDFTWEEDIAKQLQAGPCSAGYAGWNFNGRIWWAADMNEWRCEVWCYRRHVETMGAATGKELMQMVSKKYGYQ